MIINSIPITQITSSVWGAAARTLTVDPATDAGAATLVWTHAARALSADPATDAGAATLVWGHATRHLSSLGSSVIAHSSTSNSTIAAASTVDFRPGAGVCRMSSICISTSTSTSPSEAGLYDGAQFMAGPNAPANLWGGGMMSGDSTVGPAAHNTDGSVTAHYSVSHIDWLV